MTDRAQRPSGLRAVANNAPWVLLTAESTAFVLLAHYSRVMPPAGGKRYLTSTAVFLVEVVKLAISLTMALYNVSKTAPPSMPATSLFFSLTSAVFTGDSWKMAIPAGLDVLSNSLLYIALSNLRAATFQVTFQLKFLTTAIFGLMLLRRSIAPRKWGLLLLLVVGVALVQIPDASTERMLQDDHANHYFPRSLEEWKAVKQGSSSGSSLQKRSATYEGIEEDILTADPHLNSTIGLLATIGAALASGLASTYFEKVLKDSSNHISLWVRNVQLAIYSIFPALFIGIVFRDGEKIAEDGFFQGYNWAVWSTIVIQALGGIVSAFYVSHAHKDARSLATTVNIILSIIGSIWLFDFEVSASFLLGSAAVLVATHYYGNPSFTPSVGGSRPPPIRVDTYEKDVGGPGGSPVAPSSNDFSIKLPNTPFLSDGISSSRPTSPAPGHARSRTEAIDQRLIEGSLQPRYSSPSPQQPFSTLSSSLHDEDPELDAFDLELLAQNDRQMAIQDADLGFRPASSLQLSFQCDHQPQNISRFFQPSYSITPHSGDASTPPDIGPRLPSSPLALLNQRKEAKQIEQYNLELNHGPYHEDTTQSSPQALSTHVSPGPKIGNQHRQGSLSHIPPSVRGIVLIPVNDIPENYRSMFTFPLFNAIQSKSFHAVYNSNDNIVLSAPTGSGKTVIMELAICRLLNTLKDERFKVVYQAPTKSLCAERFRDWHSRFSSLNLKCAELTGDTDHMQLRVVQSSQIIITTPEKWDSMTRKWKDHGKLMQLVKLFLIDEVHILKETRGATLEAVVSRMKNIGSNVRFVALSATVPNSEDIATWLGKDATNHHVPAHREHFGEEFRPVTLTKVVYGYQSTLNDFAFDKICGSKLPEVIGMHSLQKPIMIFCCTRNSSLSTAKELARLWTMTNPPARLWKGPARPLDAHNDDLKKTIAAGVAFHHAGLGPGDRHTVEAGFRDGHISVICCTSTLAVGVNLPCHLVIIKNTVSWQDGGCKEYSDLEMMQMLGRAGRPQFDDSATAVILTRKERVNHYEQLVSGSESLESCLHLNLIDHLNAEIGLGNISDIDSAVKWLAGTFLFVRLRRNPTHYKLKEGANQEDENELLRQICAKDIHLLREVGLVEADSLCSTQFGNAMARYYIRFETMKVLLSLKPRATLSETLNVISQGDEFREIRLKGGEKFLYREINRDPGIRFPIKVDIALPCHKTSLLLQSELGAIDYPDSDQLQKFKFTFAQDKSLVFYHVNRLVRCLIDCQIARGDSIAILNALELARSFGAKVWDHSPLQMKQIEQVGVVAVRKFAAAGITSIESLEETEAYRIDMVLSKNPPFGAKLLSRLKEFPKLRVAVRMLGKEVNNGGVTLRFKVEVAFMNDKIPTFFQRRPVYVCCLTETSDGRMVDFRRTGASKLQERLDIDLSAELTSAEQFVVCHVMCDDIAGTGRLAELRPKLSPLSFTPMREGNLTSTEASHSTANISPSSIREMVGSSCTSRSHRDAEDHVQKRVVDAGKATSMSRSNVSAVARNTPKSRRDFDDLDFDGDDLQLDDFLAVNERSSKPKHYSKPTFQPNDEMDWFSIDTTPSPPQRGTKISNPRDDERAADMKDQEDENPEPIRLANGKWACNHRCKDKTSCKHFCCRDGLEKPPKPAKKRSIPAIQKENGLNQLTISDSITKIIPTSNFNPGSQMAKQRTSESKKTDNSSKTKSLTSQVGKKSSTQAKFALSDRSRSIFSSKTKRVLSPLRIHSSDYGDDDFNDLISPSLLLVEPGTSFARPNSPMTEKQTQHAFGAVPSIATKHATCSAPSAPQAESSLGSQTKPSTPQIQHEVIEIQDGTPPEYAEQAVPTHRVPSKQSTLSTTMERNRARSLKRKPSQIERRNDKSQDRSKRNSSISSFMIQPLKYMAGESPLSLQREASSFSTLEAGVGFTAEWHDDGISDLFDNFKDIIDFN
ncbi:hypothetical protein N7444_006788 [Penicillium canescens]|nr:hypothetical protein N7444_006788 [Penicillium canescens]